MENDEFAEQEKNERFNVTTVPVKTRKPKNVYNWILFILSCAVSLALLIMFFAAADSVKTGGLEIMCIESVGGRTLEEAYYHGLGYIYEGYCVAIRAIGVFCSTMLFLFGASRLKNDKK